MQMSPCPSILRSGVGTALVSPTSFDIIFAPMLQVVSTMRRFVLALYERVLKDGAASAQMALVTHELLENAVKYNSHDGTLLRITMTLEPDPVPSYCVEIRTRNHAAPENIRLAEGLVARVRDAADPELLYQQMMRCSVEQSEGSGLGLARIRAETEMSIEVHTEGDEIEICARTMVAAGGAR